MRMNKSRIGEVPLARAWRRDEDRATASFLPVRSIHEERVALLPERGGGEETSLAMVVEERASFPEGTEIEASEDTAHIISNDPWYQGAFVLTTGVISAYVLGYSGSIMVHLGWAGGTIGLILAAAISLHANILVARMHEVGGKRRIRYRDLAGYIYGRKMYYVTWTLQYINLFMINIGYVILAGQALKAMDVLYRGDSAMKLPYFIAISGSVCALFAFGIPHLSALRIWLGISTFLSLTYIIVACVWSLRDGTNLAVTFAFKPCLCKPY